jgi:hypothetical protein
VRRHIWAFDGREVPAVVTAAGPTPQRCKDAAAADVIAAGYIVGWSRAAWSSGRAHGDRSLLPIGAGHPSRSATAGSGTPRTSHRSPPVCSSHRGAPSNEYVLRDGPMAYLETQYNVEMPSNSLHADPRRTLRPSLGRLGAALPRALDERPLLLPWLLQRF